jgi:hypothetical protein
MVDREQLLQSKIPDHPTKVMEYFLGGDKPQLTATYTLQDNGTVTCDVDNDFMERGVWDGVTDTMVPSSAGEAFLKALFLVQRVGCSMTEFVIS